MHLVPSVRRTVAAFLLGALALVSAHAAPTPIVPPPALVDGFKVEWAQVDASPHSIADAVNALNGAGGFNVLNRATQFMDFVDLQDADVPFAGADPLFAVRVSGFITLAAGRYSFLSFHDDGLRLTVGGDEVITFNTDTANVQTDSAFFDLAAGVYEYEAISWEQGGAFNLQLGIDFNGARDFVLGSRAAVVPEPASLGLAAFGLLAAGLAGRRRATRAA
ncbi:PEP-CTERM sorting domain-containing protein [Ideonella sp. A 288]|uniref:PEP-CTERM sorting domain-containing protein n=1 Tax=Ideonella sp. A 288 TaxID=1962181 RepID=UPI000B4A8717|nr:PEP-CTERM sorting domain-containing protein [Ideonella sp. A 288]